MECFKCGVSDEKKILFDAISSEGVVKICKMCSFDEDIPVIRKPVNFNLKISGEKRQTVYERLSYVAKIEERQEKSSEIVKQNEVLQKISNQNAFDLAQYSKKMENLVEHFHWIIMRARRSQKLTQEQFAEKIEEPVTLIKLAEKGIISEGKYDFVKKLESNLGIRILKEEFPTSSFDEEKEKVKRDLLRKVARDEIDFDEVTTKTLTISDLNELKKKQERDIFEDSEEPGYMINKNVGDGEPEFLWDKKDLSEDEMNDIIFGRK